MKWSVAMLQQQLGATGFLLALAMFPNWPVSHAHADGQRNVVINGERVSAAQLQSLDGAHCGRIPDGRYWLSLRTGLWGHAGNALPQGHISDPCRNRRRPSYSERGLHIPPGGDSYGRDEQMQHKEIWREDSGIGTSTLPHLPDIPQEH